jgi:hypothetical protein
MNWRRWGNAAQIFCITSVERRQGACYTSV